MEPVIAPIVSVSPPNETALRTVSSKELLSKNAAKHLSKTKHEPSKVLSNLILSSGL